MAALSLLPDGAMEALYGSGAKRASPPVDRTCALLGPQSSAPALPGPTLRRSASAYAGALAACGGGLVAVSSQGGGMDASPRAPAPAAAPAAARDLRAIRSLVPPMAYSVREQKPLGQILSDAGKKALGGGIPGAAAMGIQVLTLMWMRTTINYQYRYGTTTTQALRTLYKEGGVVRFYRGLGPALLQAPLSRFGDTAANAGMLALLDEHDSTRTLPMGVKTLAASVAAGVFRIVLIPVDAVKTAMQVEGAKGLPMLAAKVRANGPTVLYHGALASSAATFVGHYPWFATYNYLNHVLPQYEELHKKLARSAFIGFSASAISDTVSNSIRVIKTTKQTSATPMSYPEVVRHVIAADGVIGLFGRGLQTKIISNGLQGLLFSVLWRIGQDWYNKKA